MLTYSASYFHSTTFDSMANDDKTRNILQLCGWPGGWNLWVVAFTKADNFEKKWKPFQKCDTTKFTHAFTNVLDRQCQCSVFAKYDSRRLSAS